MSVFLPPVTKLPTVMVVDSASESMNEFSIEWLLLEVALVVVFPHSNRTASKTPAFSYHTIIHVMS